MGTLLLGLWMIYLMQTKLDNFDWNYHKNDIWFNCVITLLFWPLLLVIYPGKLFNVKRLFDFDIVLGNLRIQGIGQRMRCLNKLAGSPPPCGCEILYSHANSASGTGKKTRLWFKSDDVVTLYKGKALPFYSCYEQAALVSWVKARDRSIKTPTEVPVQINFQNIAVSLLDAGFGLIECNACAIQYSADKLRRQMPSLHRGWNKITYRCPKGHALLQYNYVHIYV